MGDACCISKQPLAATICPYANGACAVCCSLAAGANNFLLRGNHFDVVRNAVGGVTDPGITFQLSTPVLARGARTPVLGGAMANAITPGRVLLTHGEQRMHLLTPGDKSMMFHADPEVRERERERLARSLAVALPHEPCGVTSTDTHWMDPLRGWWSRAHARSAVGHPGCA